MQPSKEIKEYGEKVCSQIRYKRARPMIREEIEGHLVDQAESYQSMGIEKKAAVEKSILEMGDPLLIGKELDQTHRPKKQWAMLLLTVSLMLMGMLFQIFIKGANSSLAFAAIIGPLLLFSFYFSDVSVFFERPFLLFSGIFLFTFFLILLPNPRLNGMPYFVLLSGISISISYLSYLVPIGIAALMIGMRNRKYWGILICQLGYLLSAILLFSIPSTSGLLLLTMITLFLLVVAHLKGWFQADKKKGLLLILLPFAVLFLLVGLYLCMNTGIIRRFMLLLNPSLDPGGSGYIPSVIHNMLSHSVLLGRGSLPETELLHPQLQPDFIFTSFIFNFGWIPFLLLLGLFIAFIIKGFLLCKKQKSMLGLLLSLSIMCCFTFQTLIDLLNNFGFLFVSQNSVPLFSAANTANILNLLLIGILLSLFRNGDTIRDTSVPFKKLSLLFSSSSKKISAFKK